jgi:hypothetical protein
MAMQNPSPGSGQVQMYGWFIPSPSTPIQIKQTRKKTQHRRVLPLKKNPSTDESFHSKRTHTSIKRR